MNPQKRTRPFTIASFLRKGFDEHVGTLSKLNGRIYLFPDCKRDLIKIYDAVYSRYGFDISDRFMMGNRSDLTCACYLENGVYKSLYLEPVETDSQELKEIRNQLLEVLKKHIEQKGMCVTFKFIYTPPLEIETGEEIPILGKFVYPNSDKRSELSIQGVYLNIVPKGETRAV